MDQTFERAEPLVRLSDHLQTPHFIVPGGRGSPRSLEVLAQGKCDKCWAAKGTWQADLGTALMGSNYNSCHVCTNEYQEEKNDGMNWEIRIDIYTLLWWFA